VIVRTWERGSGETLACGTGACAVYSVIKKTGKIDLGEKELKVNLYGGTLKISGDINKGIYMVGPAEEVFSGYFNF
jgi:diaminopimelate epimerase (EC 5.1.1.7)